MKDSEKLHREAMDLAERATLLRMRGEVREANKWAEAAFSKEKDAALKVASNLLFEPTRSVLLRSAATLALECRELREAERLASLALSGNPPDEIADELREVLEKVYTDLEWTSFTPRMRKAG